MCRYIPPEHCKQVLNEMCRALRLCYVNVLTQVRTGWNKMGPGGGGGGSGWNKRGPGRGDVVITELI